MVKSRAVDVQRTREYASAFLIKLIWIPAIALILGLFGLVYQSHRGVIPAWLCLIFGASMLGYVLFRQFKPEKPLLVLSPHGMIYRNASECLIPWQEILNISATDLTDRSTVVNRTFKGLTVVWVSRQFHETAVLPGMPLWRRTPGFENNFISKGPRVGIIILDGMLWVPSSAALRAEIEARWRAFTDKPRGPDAPPVLTGKPVTAGAALAASFALAFLVIFVLGGIALMRGGWWPTSSSSNEAYWKDMEKRDRQRQREIDKLWEDVKKPNEAEKMMERVFPDKPR
jgi:hypothetical protein